MNQDERRKLETSLVAMGLDGCQDSDIIPVFVGIIQDFPGDKHWFFRGLLNECDPASRGGMYDSLKAHFTTFKPKPLATYMNEITEDAARMVSHRVMRVEGRRPDAIQVGNEFFVDGEKQGNSPTDVMIKMVCSTCQTAKLFVAESVVSAVIKAREKGWVREIFREREICPKCPKPVKTLKVSHA